MAKRPVDQYQMGGVLVPLPQKISKNEIVPVSGEESSKAVVEAVSKTLFKLLSNFHLINV